MKRKVLALLAVCFTMVLSGCDCDDMRDMRAFLLGGKRTDGKNVKGLRLILSEIKDGKSASELCGIEKAVTGRLNKIYNELEKLGHEKPKHAEDAETLRDALDRVRNGIGDICQAHKSDPSDPAIQRLARRLHENYFKGGATVRNAADSLWEESDCAGDDVSTLIPNPRHIDEGFDLKRAIQDQNSTPAHPADTSGNQRAV